MGHLGFDKVVELVKQRFYWWNYENNLKTFIKKYCQCLKNKKPNQTKKHHQRTLSTIKGQYEYLLVVVDHFLKYAQAFPTKNKSGRAAAEIFFNKYFLDVGFLLQRILYDQGESAKLHVLCAHMPMCLACLCASRANMVTCSHALCAHVPMCLACLGAYVLTCLACLHAHVPTCLACLCAHVPMCRVCLCAHVPKCPVCLCAYMPMCLACLHAHLPKCLLACFACQCALCTLSFLSEIKLSYILTFLLPGRSL